MAARFFLLREHNKKRGQFDLFFVKNYFQFNVAFNFLIAFFATHLSAFQKHILVY